MGTLSIGGGGRSVKEVARGAGTDSPWPGRIARYVAAVMTRSPADERRTTWLFFAALGAMWFALFYRLAFVWETDDQYSHGWMVPFFAAWIFARRWSTRPDPVPPSRIWPAAIALAVLWLPAAAANLVLEASPSWRPMMWLFAGAVFAASLLLARVAGGGPWLRHFAFPFFFALAAVPWPYDTEKWLTLELSMLGARISGMLLNLGGILAQVQGNNIEIEAGVLGVEDACSGVRSFQSSLMVALLFGEWFGFRAGWRVFLAVAGIVAAYLLNIARMLLLCLAAHRGGVGVIDQWHDPAGFAILLISMVFLWALSLALQRLPGATRALPPAPVPAPAPRRGIVPLAVAALCAVALLFLSCESWYRWRESLRGPADTWTLAPVAPGAVEEPLAEVFAQTLGYDSGILRRWTRPGGRSVELIYMRWLPGKKSEGEPHSPDWCQGASGRTITGKSPVRFADFGRIVLPYQIYSIRDGRRVFYLLFVFDNGFRDAGVLSSGLMRTDVSYRMQKFLAVLEGNRHKGMASLQIALLGETDPVVAERELLAVLQELVVERQP